jgi:hypothetical protein
MMRCYRNILLYKNNIKVISDQWKYILCTINFGEQAYTATSGSVKGSILATLKCLDWKVTGHECQKGSPSMASASHGCMHTTAQCRTSSSLNAFQNVQIFKSVSIYLKFCVQDVTYLLTYSMEQNPS